MCIIRESSYEESNEVTGYKIISVNKLGVKLPIFANPVTFCMKKKSTKEKMVFEDYNDINESPYDEWNNHRLEAFVDVNDATRFYNYINFTCYNIFQDIRKIELWECKLLPVVYRGIWDMDTSVDLYSAHQIKLHRCMFYRDLTQKELNVFADLS